MERGKSIRIYLKDGTVSGIKQAEVVTRTILAFSCPRNKLADLNKIFQKETNRPGVYFLFGDESAVPQIAYIGEAENVWERLKNHDTQKDFWNEVVLITSKDDNLTKAHVKFLESRLVKIATTADRYKLQNSTVPSLTSLPIADRDSMEDFIDDIRLLVGTLGHKFLENPIQNQEPQVELSFTAATSTNQIVIATSNLELELNSRTLKAKALQTDEGIVVLEGSEISPNSSPGSYSLLRDRLITDGIIGNSNGGIKFLKNYLFDSPSAAGAVILGYNTNGRTTWKDKSGKTLKEIEEIQISS
jgi:hypothetical protein